jgi:hypothetical protein
VSFNSVSTLVLSLVTKNQSSSRPPFLYDWSGLGVFFDSNKSKTFFAPKMGFIEEHETFMIESYFLNDNNKIINIQRGVRSSNMSSGNS